MFDLTGKKALVTGATGGIGGSVAKALAAAGATLAISGSKQEKLEALNNDVFSGKAVPIACDLSKLDSVEELIKQAEEKLGGIDILVCNAGVTKDNLAMRMKDDEWQQVIDINMSASFRMTRAVIKGMMKRRYGRIIYVTSVVAGRVIRGRRIIALPRRVLRVWPNPLRRKSLHAGLRLTVSRRALSLPI